MTLNEILKLCDPLAVAGSVVLPVADSTQDIVCGRPFSHVFEKVRKFFPSPADFNSSIARTSPNRFIASIVHSLKTVPSRSVTHPMGSNRTFSFYRPLAIFRRIGAFRIFSLKPVLFSRRLSHILQKVLEIFDPSLANSSHAFPAPCFHIGPNAVNSCALKPVCAKTFTGLFVSKTAATFVGPCSNQARGFHLLFSAAIATAVPIANSLLASTLGNYRQPTRSHAGQVVEFHL